MTKINIPCHWDKKILSKIIKQNSRAKNIKITEMYGVLARGPVPHGRSPNAVPDVAKKDAVIFREYARSLGIKFIYVTRQGLPLVLLSRQYSTKILRENRLYIIDKITEKETIVCTGKRAVLRGIFKKNK